MHESVCMPSTAPINKMQEEENIYILIVSLDQANKVENMQKFRVNFSQVRKREQELESRLELVSMDSATQLKTRDEKIMDLKRKIDSLEFNMESLESSEKKSKSETKKLERKLSHVMDALKSSLNQFKEDDESLSDSD